MTTGFDQPLYILPFDHRGSFQTKMFGWTGTLTDAQTTQVAAAKQVIYDGFKAVGRTTFWDPLIDWRDKKTTRQAAVTEIARRFRSWVDTFERARGARQEEVGVA